MCKCNDSISPCLINEFYLVCKCNPNFWIYKIISKENLQTLRLRIHSFDLHHQSPYLHLHRVSFKIQNLNLQLCGLRRHTGNHSQN